MRDAAILLVFLLVVLSIRITPAEQFAGLVPEAHAAAAESSAEAGSIAPAIRSSSSSPYSLDREARPLPTAEPPPSGPCDSHSPGAPGDSDGRERVLRIELQRDRSLEAVMDSSPIDPDRPREAPAAGAAC